ncbi:hypothetical protein FA09DRAFT_221208 [Tilletiopsis washingtonensis]|uniref:Uncharacterized protein n=1 Tax=Tilletiopsis washingtonensis TaxID=58919 RepID=A0A316ZHR9_9BASI|nr:hypothetical protein FA09DRAFT_221208 [Tilletiopsis washingtonensis]PWN99835.1 hypothetical protein FA09DRAFT_221208 [Tilletiopsis washingtonensis]
MSVWEARTVAAAKAARAARTLAHAHFAAWRARLPWRRRPRCQEAHTHAFLGPSLAQPHHPASTHRRRPKRTTRSICFRSRGCASMQRASTMRAMRVAGGGECGRGVSHWRLSMLPRQHPICSSSLLLVLAACDTRCPTSSGVVRTWRNALHLTGSCSFDRHRRNQARP